MSARPRDPPTAATSTTTSPNHRITVAVRIRPLNEREVTQCHRMAAEIPSPNVVVLSKNERFNAVLASQRAETHEFAFDHAFGPESTSKEIYERCAKSMVGDVLQGTNCTVFAYGATSAGKTHTMLGTPTDPGIIPRAMMDLFTQAATIANTTGKYVTLKASFLEIYNETIRDLLSDREKVLNPCEEEATGVVRVLGITERRVENLSEIMSLLLEGSSRRKTEPTAVNQVSSRSHAILQVQVMVSSTLRDSLGGGRTSNNQNVPPPSTRRHTLAAYDANAMAGRMSSGGGGIKPPKSFHGRLSLIDLAGSERAANTNNTGARLREGASINKSLLALANCINSLSCGGRVKYRDSKLTHVLKSSLDPTSGNRCRVTMIAAVTPSHRSFEESMNTLKYASRAKEIEVVPPPPVAVPSMITTGKIATATIATTTTTTTQPKRSSSQRPLQQQPPVPPQSSSSTTISSAFFVNELESRLRQVESERDALLMQLGDARNRIAELEGTKTTSSRRPTKRGKSEARLVTMDLS